MPKDVSERERNVAAVEVLQQQRRKSGRVCNRFICLPKRYPLTKHIAPKQYKTVSGTTITNQLRATIDMD
jgi:hypothetical protein